MDHRAVFGKEDVKRKRSRYKVGSVILSTVDQLGLKSGVDVRGLQWVGYPEIVF